MSKTYKSNIPTTTKGNLDLLSIVNTDIALEAKQLKELVEQILHNNHEIKVDHSNRLAHAKKRLSELDQQMQQSDTNDSFNSATVIEDVIEMKNKIFLARQEIRFFENKQSSTQLDSLQEIYQSLVSSVDILNSYEENFRSGLLQHNQTLYLSQSKITNDVINLMNQLFELKIVKVQEELSKLHDIYDNINQLETDFYDFADKNIAQFSALQTTSSTHFTDEDDDLFIHEKIKAEYDDIIKELNISAQVITSEYEEQRASIMKSYDDYLAEIKKDQKIKNSDVLDLEKSKEEQFKEKLKAIKLQIISAEKKSDFSLVAKLLKQYENLEKTGVSSKVSDQSSKDLLVLIDKAKATTSSQLLTLEKEYATSINRVNHNIALEKIKFDEAKILHKIKSDHKGLEDDLMVNDERITKLKEFVDMKVIIGARILDFKLQLRLAELQIMKNNELLELELIKEYKELLIGLKQVENTHTIHLKQNLNNYLLIKSEQEYQANKSILDLKLNRDLAIIENDIITKRNESFIENEEYRASAKDEITYQESLIEIAKREHTLQLEKLSESIEKVDPIEEEIIVPVPEEPVIDNTAVIASLELEMELANQQIENAKIEFNKSVQTIQQTLSQELDAANLKIASFRQKYQEEKSLIHKELAEKTEDLNFKLLLFTDEKDNREIKQKIDELTAVYQAKINEIELVEKQDENIIKTLQENTDATNRARSSIKEAQELKEQTISSFEKVLAQAKEKLDGFTQAIVEETIVQVEEPIVTPEDSLETRYQKAVNEADLLLQNQIVESERIIKETKGYLANLENQEQSDSSVKELLEKKEFLIKTHHEQTNSLLELKNKETANLDIAVKEMTQNVEKEFAVIQNTMFANISYRNSEDIEHDYQFLEVKENDIYNKHVLELELFKKEFLSRSEQTSNQVKALINASLVPYNKYIEYASKGLVATKKDLANEYDKLLKQSMNEINNRFKRDSLM